MATQNQVIILHGAYGNANENWFPWLRDNLLSEGIQANTPVFPTPENQSIESWTEILNNSIEVEFSHLTLVGHSASCPFILTWLENIDEPIRAMFLVSSFIQDLGLPEFDEINRIFYNREYNWKNIKKNCQDFFVIHSDNDPYVPLDLGKEIAKKLEVKIEILHEAGHINSAAGFNKFPLLLQKIIGLLSE